MLKGIVIWTASVIAALLLLVAGTSALLGVGYGVATWGQAALPRMLIGVIDLVGLVLLLVPRTSFAAAIALSPIATAAVYIGFSIGILPVPGMLVLVCLLVVAFLRASGDAGAPAESESPPIR